MKYTCALCRGTFTAPGDWTDADAQKEYEQTFSAEARAAGGQKVVCDDCYARMTTERPPKEWEARRRK